MRTTLILSLLAAFLLCSHFVVDATDSAGPNSLFILTDDQGYGDVTLQGHPLLKTPNLNALHDQSACFSNSTSARRARPTYTKENAQFHWGVTPRGQWSLFDLKSDQSCRKDLASEKRALVTTLADTYDKWWDDLFPDMIMNGGDKGEPDKLGKKGASAN